MCRIPLQSFKVNCDRDSFPPFPASGFLEYYGDIGRRSENQLRSERGFDFRRPCIFASDGVAGVARDWHLETASMRGISVVVVISSDEEVEKLERRLLASPVWNYPDTSARHELIVLDNRKGCEGIPRQPLPSPWFNAAILSATHEILLFTQSDVYFSADTFPGLEESLNELDEFDPSWVVAGAVGKRLTPVAPNLVRSDMFGTYCHFTLGCSNIHGPHKDPVTIADANYSLMDHLPRIAEADTLDETFLVVHRRKALRLGLWFDPIHPFHHAIGSMLVLDARVRGRRSYVLPTVQMWHRIGYGEHSIRNIPEAMHSLRCKFFSVARNVFCGRPLFPTSQQLWDRLDAISWKSSCTEDFKVRCQRKTSLHAFNITFDQIVNDQEACPPP